MVTVVPLFHLQSCYTPRRTWQFVYTSRSICEPSCFLSSSIDFNRFYQSNRMILYVAITLFCNTNTKLRKGRVQTHGTLLQDSNWLSKSRYSSQTSAGHRTRDYDRAYAIDILFVFPCFVSSYSVAAAVVD